MRHSKHITAEYRLKHSVFAAKAAPETSTLCTALRDATHFIHQRLHDAPLLGRLLRGALSMTDYLILLRSYIAFYAAINEPLLAGRRILMERSKSALHLDEWDPLTLLQADLETCCRQARTSTTPITHSVAAPSFTTMQTLGCLYVAEGSRLGARVLYRHLDRLFGSQQAGRSFLAASTQPAAWQTLCSELNSLPLQHTEANEVIAGAMTTFSLFEQLLQQDTQPLEQCVTTEQSA